MPENQVEFLMKFNLSTLPAVIKKIILAMSSDPAPRTYDGNPSAGATPSTAELAYEEAQRDAKPDHVIFHKWRW